MLSYPLQNSLFHLFTYFCRLFRVVCKKNTEGWTSLTPAFIIKQTILCFGRPAVNYCHYCSPIIVKVNKRPKYLNKQTIQTVLLPDIFLGQVKLH